MKVWLVAGRIRCEYVREINVCRRTKCVFGDEFVGGSTVEVVYGRGVSSVAEQSVAAR